MVILQLTWYCCSGKSKLCLFTTMHVAATVIIPNMALSLSQQAGAANGLDAANSTAAVAHPQQLFQELRQYSRLLGRPKITAALQAEQAALAKQVRCCCILSMLWCAQRADRPSKGSLGPANKAYVPRAGCRARVTDLAVLCVLRCSTPPPLLVSNLFV